MKADYDSKLAMYRSVAALLADSATQVARMPVLVARLIRLHVKMERLFSLGDTPAIEPTILEVDFLLEREIDPLLLGFRTTDPQFYRKYQAARIIIDRPGGRNEKATTTTAISAAATTSAATPATTS